MKRIITIILIVLSINVSAQNCVTNVSTNTSDPIDEGMESAFPGKVNPWLNIFSLVSASGAMPEVALNQSMGWLGRGSNPSAYSVLNPFNINGNMSQRLTTTNLDQVDADWRDGWEYLYFNTGYYPNGEALNSANLLRITPTTNNSLMSSEFPMIVMYNRYTGKLRTFLMYNGTFATGFDAMNTIWRYDQYEIDDANISQTFRHLTNYDVAMDQKTSVLEVATNTSYENDQTEWWDTEIQLAYDPCICNREEPVQLQLKVLSIDTQVVNLYGREISLVEDLADANGKPTFDKDFLLAQSIQNDVNSGNLMYNSMGEMVTKYGTKLSDYNTKLADYKSAKNQSKIIINSLAKDLILKGVSNAITPPAIKAVNAFLDSNLNSSKFNIGSDQMKNIIKAEKVLLGKGYDFLSAQIGLKPLTKPSKPNTPTATFSEMRLSGTIRSTGSTEIGHFILPGSKPSEQYDNSDLPDVLNFPAYNNPVGLFALLETPAITVVTDQKKTTKSVTFEETYAPIHNGTIQSLSYGEANPKIIVEQEVDPSTISFSVSLNEALKFDLNDAVDFDEDKTDITVAFKVYFEDEVTTITPYAKDGGVANFGLHDYGGLANDIIFSSNTSEHEFNASSRTWDFEELDDSKYDFLYTPANINDVFAEWSNLPSQYGSATFDRMSWQMSIQKSKGKRELMSAFYPIRDFANTELSSVVTSKAIKSTFTDPLQIGKYDVIKNNKFWIPRFNSEIKKIEMKVMADMYFNQVGSDGEQVNTTQIFTYLLYDKDKGINVSNPSMVSFKNNSVNQSEVDQYYTELIYKGSFLNRYLNWYKINQNISAQSSQFGTYSDDMVNGGGGNPALVRRRMSYKVTDIANLTPMYDQEKENRDYFGGQIDLESAGTIVIGPNHPWVIRVEGNKLYIKASVININATIDVASGYELIIQGEKNIETTFTSQIGQNITLELIKNFRGKDQSKEATLTELSSFCNMNSGQYSGNESSAAFIKPKDDTSDDIKPLPIATFYPNPTNDIIRVNIQNTELNLKNRFIVMDITGKELINEVVLSEHSSEFAINLSEFVKGIYFIKVIDSSGNVYTSKVIKK